MKLEKIVDIFIYGGLDIAERLPSRLLRFMGTLVAYVVMVVSSVIWMPLAIVVGFKDIWDDLKVRRGKP